jgi:5-carboxymethyl-2-hydroxymuconate isomerase
MPHFIVEYSANLEPTVNIGELISTVHKAAIASGVFPLKGTRTRAARRDLYEIADGHADNGFVHITARIGQGRNLDVRQEAGELIYEAACEYLRSYFEQHPLAISFEMQEIDADTSFKFNNLPAWIERRQSL